MLKISPSDSILGILMIHDIAEDVGGYNYYGYLSRDGDFIIMRQKVDGTEIRYASGDTSYFTAWSSKGSLDYNYLCNL